MGEGDDKKDKYGLLGKVGGWVGLGGSAVVCSGAQKSKQVTLFNVIIFLSFLFFDFRLNGSVFEGVNLD